MAEQLTTDTLRPALAGEFRAAIEAVLGTVLTATDGQAPGGAGWGTPITAGGSVEGQFTAWVDQPGVTAIAKAMLDVDGTPEPGVAAEMLKEIWSQAAAAVALKPGFEGLRLDAGSSTPGTLPASGAGLVLRDGDTVLATLTITGTVAAARAATAVAASGPGAWADYPGNLAALLDVDLPLVVRFARTEMPLRALAQLVPGSMVDMGRSPDAPVQLLIGSQVIAEGEVVVVSGNYGVRITSLVSPADRLRAMEL